MIFLLSACSDGLYEANPFPDAEDPTAGGLSGCAFEATQSETGLIRQHCVGTYDGSGNETLHLCVSNEGYIYRIRRDVDDEGCLLSLTRYANGTWGSSADVTSATCDEFGSKIAESGQVVQVASDHSTYTYSFDWSYQNDYLGGELVSVLRDGPDGGRRRHQAFEYEAGLLKYSAEGWEGQDPEILNYFNWDGGDLLVAWESESRWDNFEERYEHDVLGRETSRTRDDFDSGMVTITRTEYENNTQRMASVLIDDGADGLIESEWSYRWTCDRGRAR